MKVFIIILIIILLLYVEYYINNFFYKRDYFTKLENDITINELVDKVYIINLDRRPDRMNKMKNLMKKYNISYERFPAIDGNREDIKNEWKKLQNTIIQTPNALGCLMSHLAIIKDAKKNNYNKILIFEDDLLFHKNFNGALNKIKYLPKDWKLLYLGASQISVHIDNIKKNGFYYKAVRTDGAFAYIIDSSIFDELIDMLEIKDGPVDYLYKRIQEKYNCYVMWPNLIIANVAESDNRMVDKNMGAEEIEKWGKKIGWNNKDYIYEDFIINNIG